MESKLLQARNSMKIQTGFQKLTIIWLTSLPRTFGALDSDRGVSWTTEDLMLSDAMGTYWTNFAKTGSPNGSGLPEWLRYVAERGFPVMHLDVALAPAPQARQDRYGFWDAGPPAAPN
jgi:carboxylesterase type B